jgi:hypothetical protein
MDEKDRKIKTDRRKKERKKENMEEGRTTK